MTVTSIKIGEPTHFNTYEVVVKHMHGDADNYTTDSIFFHADGSHLHEDEYEDESVPTMLGLVNFMLACQKEFPHGMGGDDGFWEVFGYEVYGDWLHLDNDCCDGHATPESIDVYFYDQAGARRVCKLV